MKSFLTYVAEDILQKYGNDLSDIAVVFPNKRAALFLNQELIRIAGKPIWSPAYITISELFRQHSSLMVADPLKSIADLHKSFIQVTGREETFDQFFGWGQLLLADFDDIDKNGADAKQVFTNLKDYHEYDNLAYLSEEQKELLKRFFHHFNDDDSILQRRFIELWSRLYEVYKDFRHRLESQGLAYEGMLYSEVANNTALKFEHQKYLFVGFNVLQQVEQQLFRRLKDAGKAAFYWDYDEYYLNNEAGVYIRQYLSKFPNELETGNPQLYDQFRQPKKIQFISARTENIQARYIAQWLQEDDRAKAGNKTAIVMCNEGLLQTVTHCIPTDKVPAVNITTGYPLQQTAIATLVTLLLNLQIQGYDTRRQAFRRRYIDAVTHHPYMAERDVTNLMERHKTALDIVNWLKGIVKSIATESADGSDATSDTQLKEEALFRMYTLLNRLHELINEGTLTIEPITLQRFVKQLVAATSIPFHGEPAIGTQVMGVLETRNLDFDHVLILSCNEGNMPKGVDDSSFIPHALRSAYGLTTIDNKVAIYSYYFHSLLQRANDVTILYNNATEGSHTGEMSRFMLQLLVEYPYPINRIALHAGQTPRQLHAPIIEKDAIVARRLDNIRKLSPTAINTYMRCQLKFYYNYVANLREKTNEDDEEFDSRQFGNVFHRAAQLIYEQLLPHDRITTEDIDKLLAPANKQIDTILDQAISEELFHQSEGTTKHPPLNGLQLISREVVDTYLRQLLRIDRQLTPFRVLDHERDVEIELPLANRNIKVGGRIDRIDAPSSTQLRIVDYKTGKAIEKGINAVADIFDPKNITSRHTDYILQAFLYSLIVSRQPSLIHGDAPTPSPAVSPALLFVQKTGKDDYNPIIAIGNEPVTDIREYADEFTSQLTDLLNKIFDLSNPFIPTDNTNICKYCSFKQMCGR